LLNSSVLDFDGFMGHLAANPNKVQSLYVCSDLWITVNAKNLIKSAKAAGIKTMFEFKEIKQNGGGDDNDPNSWQTLFEQAADYADKILKGSRAGDLKMYTLTNKRGRSR
jgi:hypothetical protein